MKHSILTNTLYISILLFCFYQNIFCQSTINVIESQKLEQILIQDTVFQKFSGNVIIEYSDLTIKCDTILIDEYQNLVRGWGGTHIFNDTLSCQSDSINIKQKVSQIIFHKNSYLKTNKMEIRSNEIIYNYKDDEIKYFKHGNVTTADYNIGSKIFTHKLNTINSYFNEDVELENEDYHIKSENIHYVNGKIFFSGKTTIQHVEFNINCENGFLQKSKTLELSNGLNVYFNNQSITANKLNRNIKTEENYFTNDVHVIIDQYTHIFGQELHQINNTSTITGNCYIQLLNEKDTTVIKGDVIRIDQDNNLSLNNNIIIDSQILQGKCEAMDFQVNYQEINMKKNPVLWCNNIQITGDEIQLYSNKNNIDSIYVPTNSFIISKVDSCKYYNQIKGKELQGKFKNKKIEYTNIYGNGELLYFKTNHENKKKISLNSVQAGQIQLFFQENNIKEVLCTEEIDSKYIEIDTIHRENEEHRLYLDKFKLRKNTIKPSF